MKKNVIALAVAAAMAAPLAAQAAPTVYGIAHLSVDKLNTDELTTQQGNVSAALGTADNGDDSAIMVNSKPHASRIGVKGSEDLGGGLKAVYGMEWGVDMSEGGTFSARNQYAGLAGGFGTILLGRHDTPMKMSSGKLDFFADEIGDYNNIAGFVDHRANNAIAYVSPNFNGLTIAAAVVAGENANNDASDDVNDGLTAATSLAAMYSNGPLYVSLGYETADADVVAATTGDNDWKATRLGVGYNVAGFDLALVYEQQDSGDNTGAVGDRAVTEIAARYTMGANAIKAAFVSAGEWSELDETDHTGYAVGVDHNFSKNTKVYAQYAAIQAGDSGYLIVKDGFKTAAAGGLAHGGDESTFSLGLKVKF